MPPRAPRATALAFIAVVLTAPSAVAVAFEGSRAGSWAGGHVTIDAHTIVSGTVADTAADGKCARLRGNWDYVFQPDQGFLVAEVCGNGKSQYGWESRTTRGGGSLRDFEVRVYTGNDHKVIWEGDGSDA